MAARPPRTCLHPGCGQLGTWPGGRCPAHDKRPILKAVERLYNTAAYKRFRTRMRGQNPICQRIIEFGGQCQRPATILHHLHAPTDMATLLDPKNCVMLCAEHHPGGEAGTPHWAEGTDYVRTIYTTPAFATG